jgi:hypothetical protein
MPLQITTDFAAIAARFVAAADAAPMLQRSFLSQLGFEAREELVTIVKAHTPVGDEPAGEGSHEHLRDTTVGDPVVLGTGIMSTAVRQTKTISIQGDSVPLWGVLTTGHDAPPDGIKPVNKQALFWPGITGGHPVGFSKGGPAAPNPYVSDAVSEFTPLLAIRAQASAEAFATSVLNVVKGSL